jgi:hypothetical protein
LEIVKRTFDICWQLESRLREEKNRRIYLSLVHKKPIVAGDITEDDLDLFLDDLLSVNDALDRGLIHDEEIGECFSDYINLACKNEEIKAYIDRVRREDREYFYYFEDMCKRTKSAEGKRDKAERRDRK